MSDLGGLQLLPSQKRNYNLHLQGNNRLLVFALVLLLLLGAAYGLLRAFASTTEGDIATAETSILAIYQARNKADENTLVSFQKQLRTTRSLLQAHTIWSADLINMQNLIEPRMKFLSLQVDRDKHSYSFHAMADSYTTVAKQIASLYGSALVQDVKVSAISATADGQVDVTMALMLKQP